MTSYSIGILDAAFDLIKKLYIKPTINFISQYKQRPKLADGRSVIDLCKKMGWVYLSDSSEFIFLTERGNEIAKSKELRLALRLFLYDIIKIEQPVWSKKIPYGRKEGTSALTTSIKQVFNSADLLLELDESIIQWWDNVGDLVRTANMKKKRFRDAEKLTIKMEYKRTGVKPEWPGFESAYAGCDVISQLSSSNKDQLNIEVKSSEQHINGAWFHVTRNEWYKAIASVNYQFHLWLINSKNKLAIIAKSDVSPHIPTDNQEGHWEDVKIPFKSYKSSFKEI